MAFTEKQVFAIQALSTATVAVALAVGWLYVNHNVKLEQAKAPQSAMSKLPMADGYPAVLFSERANAHQERFVVSKSSYCRDNAYPDYSELAIVGHSKEMEPAALALGLPTGYPPLGRYAVNESAFFTNSGDAAIDPVKGKHQVVKVEGDKYAIVDVSRVSPAPLLIKCETNDDVKDSALNRLKMTLAIAKGAGSLDIKREDGSALTLLPQEVSDPKVSAWVFKAQYGPAEIDKAAKDFELLSQTLKTSLQVTTSGFIAKEYRVGELVHAVGAQELTSSKQSATAAMLIQRGAPTLLIQLVDKDAPAKADKDSAKEPGTLGKSAEDEASQPAAEGTSVEDEVKAPLSTAEPNLDSEAEEALPDEAQSKPALAEEPKL